MFNSPEFNNSIIAFDISLGLEFCLGLECKNNIKSVKN